MEKEERFTFGLENLQKKRKCRYAEIGRSMCLDNFKQNFPYNEPNSALSIKKILGTANHGKSPLDPGHQFTTFSHIL
jgi:hypothetical protein